MHCLEESESRKRKKKRRESGKLDYLDVRRMSYNLLNLMEPDFIVKRIIVIYLLKKYFRIVKIFELK